jgi:SNF2 family DNA or RNA helicase
VASDLWAHQRDAVERAKELRDFALFFDIGTGKTRTMIDILRYRCNVEKRLLRTLIFAPLSVCPQWKKEFEKFSKIDQEKILVLTMNGKTRTTHLESLKGTGAIVVTNYEAVQIESFYDALLKWRPEVVIYDESHKLKAATTSRHKKCVPLSDAALHRYLLTGTPVLNTPMDLFGQYRLLDGGQQFGKSFFVFRKSYFHDKNAGMPKQKYFPKWEVKQELLPIFSKVIAATAAQAKKSECLDLPPLIKSEITVELGKDQRKAYESMKAAFLAELEGVTTVAEFAMTRTLRLQQIVSGYVSEVVNGEEKVAYVKDNPRLDAFTDLLESLEGEKVIVWTTFRATYGMLGRVAKELGRTSVFLTGEQSAKEKEESIEAFRFGDADTLIANPQAGGAGINLQEAPYSIYYARNYSLEQYLQSEGRNYRGGSDMHEKVQHFHLMAKDTIDEVILNALMKKQNLADAILSWAKEQRKKLEEEKYLLQV